MAPIRALASVNLAAVERNCRRLKDELDRSAALAAVVKADGYGHGASASAHAALAGGASWLAVATAEEAAALRRDGLDARILVMGALTDEELTVALAADADLVAWCEPFVERLAALGGARVHVKLDSGMGRLGTRDIEQARRVAAAVDADDRLELAGAMTHFATADETDNDFFAEQLARFQPFADEVKRAHPDAVVHAANSAATLRERAAHFDLVRCGVAVYGMDPFLTDPSARGLEPALELLSYVADVKPVEPGESVGYGRRFVAQRQTRVAVLPIGYGDGVRRGLTNNADVLIGGRRHPLVGTVSMDNITVDLGLDSEVAPGDEAKLIGASGEQWITAEEVAQRLDTINYEVTCSISARVPRVHHRDGLPWARERGG
ncbi:MAG TPA: alanine racemase [Solirubrobacteraceae bacterium]|nr:alanine racemase [Solirubrobacteraceae bacterium]